MVVYRCILDSSFDCMNDKIINCNNFNCRKHSKLIMDNLYYVIKSMIDVCNLFIPKVKV